MLLGRFRLWRYSARTSDWIAFFGCRWMLRDRNRYKRINYQPTWANYSERYYMHPGVRRHQHRVIRPAHSAKEVVGTCRLLPLGLSEGGD